MKKRNAGVCSLFENKRVMSLDFKEAIMSVCGTIKGRKFKI